jgi:hypothetical protein
MKTVLQILAEAGNYRRELYLRIENPPHMVLVIEAMPEPGPLGAPAISVAHYGKQNGDLMRDPEMCFELTNPLGMGWIMTPYYYRNDFVGVEQFSRTRDVENYIVYPDLFQVHESFARTWNKNLRAQEYIEAFRRRG